MFGLSRTTWFASVALGVIFVSPAAEANVLLSVFHASVVLMVLALIPVVIVESIVIAVQGSISWGAALWAATVANIVSTLAGVPFTRSILTAFAGFGPRWLKRVLYEITTPLEGGPNLPGWVEIFCFAVIFLMYYCASIFIEAWVLAGWVAPAGRAAFWANTINYGAIMALVAVQLVVDHRRAPKTRIRSPAPPSAASAGSRTSSRLRVPDTGRRSTGNVALDGAEK